MRSPLAQAVGAVVAAAAVYTVGAYAVSEWFPVGVVKRGPAHRRVALTFDDGPDPTYTPRILDGLAAAGVQAAFFLVGRRVEAAPDVVRAMAAAGHDLGNHTYSHRHLWSLPPRATIEEVDLGAAAVANATGIRPRYFRPPWGMFNLAAYVRTGQIGERRVLWSVRPEGLLAAADAARMTHLTVAQAHPGAIVNLHDCGGHPSTPKETWLALPAMIAGLRARGFEVVPLRTLLAAPRGA